MKRKLKKIIAGVLLCTLCITACSGQGGAVENLNSNADNHEKEVEKMQKAASKIDDYLLIKQEDGCYLLNLNDASKFRLGGSVANVYVNYEQQIIIFYGDGSIQMKSLANFKKPSVILTSNGIDRHYYCKTNNIILHYGNSRLYSYDIKTKKDEEIFFDERNLIRNDLSSYISNNEFFIDDRYNNRCFSYNLKSKKLQYFSYNSLKGATYLGRSKNGMIYVSCPKKETIEIYSFNTDYKQHWIDPKNHDAGYTIEGDIWGKIKFPIGYEIYEIAENDHNLVYEYNTNFTIVDKDSTPFVIGRSGGVINESLFVHPEYNGFFVKKFTTLDTAKYNIKIGDNIDIVQLAKSQDIFDSKIGRSRSIRGMRENSPFEYLFIDNYADVLMVRNSAITADLYYYNSNKIGLITDIYINGQLDYLDYYSGLYVNYYYNNKKRYLHNKCIVPDINGNPKIMDFPEGLESIDVGEKTYNILWENNHFRNVVDSNSIVKLVENKLFLNGQLIESGVSNYEYNSLNNSLLYKMNGLLHYYLDGGISNLTPDDKWFDYALSLKGNPAISMRDNEKNQNNVYLCGDDGNQLVIENASIRSFIFVN